MPHPGGPLLAGPEEVCAGCGKTAEILHQSDDDEYANYSPRPRFCPDCMIGKKVKVFWPVDNSWYSGTVKHYNAPERSHLLEYSDGDTEWVKIAEIQPQPPPPPDLFVGGGMGIAPHGALPIGGAGGPIMRPSISPVNTDSAGELRNPASPKPPPDGSPERSWQQAPAPPPPPPPHHAPPQMTAAPAPPTAYQVPYPMAHGTSSGASRGASAAATAPPPTSSPYSHYSPYGSAPPGHPPPPHYPPPPTHYGAPPPNGPYPPTVATAATTVPPYPPTAYPPPPPTAVTGASPVAAASPYPPPPRTPPTTTATTTQHPSVEKTNSRGSDLGHPSTTPTAATSPAPHGGSGIGLSTSSVGSVMTAGDGAGGPTGDNNSVASSTTSSSINNSNNKRKAGPRVWSKAEDATLLNMVQTMKMPIKWSVVAQSLVDRTGKQCRERYVNHLNPRLKVADWNPVEDATIFQLYNSTGSHWAKMSKMIPGRTDNGIKNRFHNLRRQLEREDEHRLRLSKVDDFPQEVRLDRLRDVIPHHMQGKADSLWDIPKGIGVLAAQSVLGGGIARNAGRFGPFQRPTNMGEDPAVACARCGLFVPSVHTGREVCTRTGWCMSCTRIPPHISGNLLRECLNLRREDNEEIRKIIESWDEFFATDTSDGGTPHDNHHETKDGEEKKEPDGIPLTTNTGT